MRALKYRFKGPYQSAYSKNEYCVAEFDDIWNNELEGFSIGSMSMQRSEYVERQIIDIQKVLSGQKAEHYFAGDSSLQIFVGKQETELYNGLEDRSIGFVPTTGLLQLMIDWRDFLKSKGF